MPDFDVLVLGGGPAGVNAALAASAYNAHPDLLRAPGRREPGCEGYSRTRH